MNDNNENKTDNNNEDELFIVYKKNTLSSHYLMKLMDGPGTHIRKSLVEGDIVIDPGGHPKSPTCGHLKIPHLVAVFKA